MTPKQFADEVSGLFRALFEKMNISNDDFIRTTEPRHKPERRNSSAACRKAAHL